MSLSECSGIAQGLPGEMDAKIFRPFQHFRLDIPAGFGSFRPSARCRSAAVSHQAEQGVGCNPAERVSPRRFAEPHPHRSQVMCRGRLHPHQRSEKKSLPSLRLSRMIWSRSHLSCGFGVFVFGPHLPLPSRPAHDEACSGLVRYCVGPLARFS